jgi:uncharacterized protein YodC (DUF2158 family)
MADKNNSYTSFTPGALVRLKSGSPAMTVIIVEGESALCYWFDRTRIFREWVSIYALEPVRR